MIDQTILVTAHKHGAIRRKGDAHWPITVGASSGHPTGEEVLDAPGTTLTVDRHTSEQISLPPIVGGHTVYSLDPGGILYALDIDTGLVRTKLSLGFAVPHFATPTFLQGRIFVETTVGVSAVTLA